MPRGGRLLNVSPRSPGHPRKVRRNHEATVVKRKDGYGLQVAWFAAGSRLLNVSSRSLGHPRKVQ